MAIGSVSFPKLQLWGETKTAGDAEPQQDPEQRVQNEDSANLV